MLPLLLMQTLTTNWIYYCYYNPGHQNSLPKWSDYFLYRKRRSLMLQKKHPFKIARKVSQDEGNVTDLNLQVFSSPDAHSMMADQELDVGKAVKLTLTSFTTAKKPSPHSSCLNGNYFKARRSCLLLATIKSCLCLSENIMKRSKLMGTGVYSYKTRFIYFPSDIFMKGMLRSQM